MKYAALLLFTLSMGFGMALRAQEVKMKMNVGAAAAQGDFDRYADRSILAGFGTELQLNRFVSASLDFGYMGFPLDTSRLDFAATLLPLHLSANLRWPINERWHPYLGVGGGLLMVRYVIAHAVNARQNYLSVMPRLGVQYEVDSDFMLDFGFQYQQSLALLGEKGEGLSLGLEDYRYWSLSLGIAYTIAGSN